MEEERKKMAMNIQLRTKCKGIISIDVLRNNVLLRVSLHTSILAYYKQTSLYLI